MKYRVIDLFAGAGGLSLGFSQTGCFNIVAAAENNTDARKTYKKNYEIKRLYSDVRTIDYKELVESVGSIDVVIGGPPCQGFSNANRQHSTLISMNNRLVKEYVRAIVELQPKAFVMENVAMLRSNVHRFIVDDEDINDPVVMGLKMIESELELLPAEIDFPNALDFIKNNDNIDKYIWDEKKYKIINLLYRFRINNEKFDNSVDRYRRYLSEMLQVITGADEDAEDFLAEKERYMAKLLLQYMDGTKIPLEEMIAAIKLPLFVQRMLSKARELIDNKIHIIKYRNDGGSVSAVVNSYAVFDYVRGVLGSDPYNYQIFPMLLNAIDFGAPQKRERCIVVGIKNGMCYRKPVAEFTEECYRTVYEAISDLQKIPTSIDVRSYEPVSLPEIDEISDLARELRGKLLYNHVSTATRAVAQTRFKALKAGQNFHDLKNELKSTYSDAERTQNTIYMRLRYDEPSGTVVNVRKSMWIHPELDRAISIREAARLQTFPDSFIFEGTKDSQYQQVGNAVPPFLAKAIAMSIADALKSKDNNNKKRNSL